MSRKTIFRLVILLIFGALLLHVLFWPGNGSVYKEIDIRAGSTAHQVSRQLMEANLIKSPVLFLSWVRLRNAGSLIHFGRYRFSEGRSAFWIADDVIAGRTEKVKFVIPEGFASWQIAARLEEMGLCSEIEFNEAVKESNAEGYLFPATYRLDHGLSALELVKTFRGQFEKMWNDDFSLRASELGWSRHMTVTMASILEREVRVRSELPLISAVYHNRLKKRMRLQADPTVQFSFGYWKTRLTYDDYKNSRSPYNTYIHFGLPPGPICSPGIDALRAALWPASSDALFMLAQDDGTHTFSMTYREHTNKVNQRNRRREKK